MRIAAVMAVHNCRALPPAHLDALRTHHVPGGPLDTFVLDDERRQVGMRWPT